MTKRRNFSDKFKASVALEALRGDKTVQEIAANNHIAPILPDTVLYMDVCFSGIGSAYAACKPGALVGCRPYD